MILKLWPEILSITLLGLAMFMSAYNMPDTKLDVFNLEKKQKTMTGEQESRWLMQANYEKCLEELKGLQVYEKLEGMKRCIKIKEARNAL